MSSIKDWTDQATLRLSGINSGNYRLEAELILANVIKTKRIKLHLCPDKQLSKTQLKKANHWLSKRLKGTPLAYLTNQKQFFGYQFLINKHVLVPRPESEIIIEQALELIPKIKQPIRIIDLGCGSGVLGISLAKELTKLNQTFCLTLADINNKALNLARTNARKQQVKANFSKTNLMANLNQEFDLMLANLPYVDQDWKFVSQVDHEPKQALFARDNGLFLIKKLINQLAPKHHFWLILESDTSQQITIKQALLKANFSNIKTAGYIIIAYKL